MNIFKLSSICCLLLLMEFSSVYGDIQKAVSTVHAVRNSAEVYKQLRKAIGAQRISITDICYGTNYDSLPLSEPCKQHVNLYHKSYMRESWAMSMCDSSTRIPEGLLTGNFQNLGNFDECIDIRDINATDGYFHGQHCLATIKLMSKPKTKQGIGSSGFMLAIMPLKVAKCVPSSCSINDTAMMVERDYQQFALYLSTMNMELKFEVLESECHTADQPDFEPEDWVAIVVLVFFAVVVVLSTGYDVLTRKAESRSNLLMAFSVYTNGKKLLAISKSEDTLHCLHGIRFLSMAWVVVSHRYMDAVYAPSQNLVTYLPNFISSWKYLFVTNGHLSVDTFFFLSGLLAAYVFFRQVPKTNSFNLPLYYLHRYIRLTPVLAVMIMLLVSLWRYTGSGPIWDTVYNADKTACVEKWWANLLYVQNYVKLPTQCLGQSWFLAVDMQLHWLSPLVLIPLWKFPKYGWILMAGLMVGGLVTNFVVSYEHDYSGSYFMAMQSATLEMSFMKLMYWPVWTRYMAYLVGVALGYVLVDIRNKRRKIQFTKVVTLLLWLIAAGIMLFTLCIVHVFQQPDYEFEPITSALYNAFDRPLWALGVGMVVFLCATGHGGIINSILSWDWFQVLSRLSYSVYLVHQSLQLTQYGSMRVPVHLDDLYAFPHFFGDMVLALIFAIPLCLVFESPFIILEKELLGGKKKSPKPPPVASTSNASQLYASAPVESSSPPDTQEESKKAPEGVV
ncbi:nose resistant to fluoxetine protein 6 [Anabrus simplex]|uniref:nose resistant to fluoxetine protein 6 n=1 Tax=Anabrus simplex TaxID=316456 RepID=UPI0035A2C7BF